MKLENINLKLLYKRDTFREDKMDKEAQANIAYWTVHALYIKDADDEGIEGRKGTNYSSVISGEARQNVGPIKKGQWITVRIKNDTVTFEYNPTMFKPQPDPEDDEELDLDTFYAGLTGKYVMTLVSPSLAEKK